VGAPVRARRAAAITGIDHVIVGVRDLEAARRRWQSLGFTLTPRGRHIGWGTANYCIMLERGYIELLGIVDPTQFTNALDAFLAEREGLLAVAFGSADGARTHAALSAAGLHPDGPKDLKRALELPEGEVLPAFSLVFLPCAETPGLSAFFCQHLTPQLLRRREWLRHDNGARSLAAVTIVADDPASTAGGWATVFGAAAIRRDGECWLVETGGGQLRFTTSSALRERYPGCAVPAVASSWAAACTIVGAGVPAAVGPAETGGLILELA
jgi:catechol 2,3-dioxygenase-like lactoylglutathione lyase family enzyme